MTLDSGRRASSKWSRHVDVLAVGLLFAAIVVFRILSLTANELSWDVFGYYIYLPATVIHHDPLLADIAWISQIQHQYNTTETLYQLTTAPDGSPMNFFMMGMAILYAPCFLVGHAVALLTGQPADGFSMPYQVSMAIGCTAYSLIGLLVLRKILRRFFSALVAAGVIVIVGFGTNYFHFVTIKNLETANFLFCGLAVLVWNTIRWHEGHRRAHLLGIAVCIAVITLIKPSEIVCGLIPLLWTLRDRASITAKVHLLRRKWMDLLMSIVIGLLVLSPQLIYWKLQTGQFVFDSYRNPGVGLDWWSPHVREVLFSFRKGWLIYTPVMVFALIGFRYLWRQHRAVFWPIALYFLTTFFIIASWSEWWYGASYSIRPMITTYVVLAIPLGCMLEKIGLARPIPRLASLVLLSGLVALNLFQTWQFNHWIIDPYRTTRPYYFAVFGRTEVPEGARDLLSMERGFGGNETLGDTAGYTMYTLAGYSFDSMDKAIRGEWIHDTLANSMVVELGDGVEFFPVVEKPFEEITSGDHFWVKARISILLSEDYTGDPPCLSMTMERKEGSYGYRTVCIADSTERGIWTMLEGEYLTPAIRDGDDRFKVYVWRRGQGSVRIDDVVVEVLTAL